MKAVLKIVDQLISVGKSPLVYDTPIIRCNDFLADYITKTNGIKQTQANSYFAIEGCGSRMSLYEYVPFGHNNRSGNHVMDFNGNEIDAKAVVEGRHIIVSELDGDTVVLSKYRIEGDDTSLCAKLVIRFEGTLKYFCNEEEVFDTTDFFSDSAAMNFEPHIKDLILRNHVNCVALKDFQLEYLAFLRDCDSKCSKLTDRLEFWYHISDEKFCYLFEFTKRNDGRTVDLIMENPVHSGCPYRDVRNASKLSSASMEMIKEYFNYGDMVTTMNVFGKMEADPRIGVNGIKLITEVNDTIKKIKLTSTDGIWNISLRRYMRSINELEAIADVMNSFDISLKTLLSRAIKGAFTEDISVGEYFAIARDYAIMRNTLGLPRETKLPKNVIELHDSLATQIRDSESAERQKLFIAQANANKVLVDAFNVACDNPEFTIICPMESKDLIEEGQNMHHCVGSYIDRVVAGYSKIYFVRQKSCPEVSFVTIELDNKNNLIQAKAKFNSNVSANAQKYVNEFVNFAGGNVCD